MTKCYTDVIKKDDISKQLKTVDDEIIQIVTVSQMEYALLAKRKLYHVKGSNTTEVDIEADALSAFLFNGAFYVTTAAKLYKLVKNELEEVVTYERDVTFAAATNDRILACYADKDVVAYNEEYNVFKTLEAGKVEKIQCNGLYALLLKNKGIEILDGITLDSKASKYFNNGKVKIYGEVKTASIARDGKYCLLGYHNGRISTLTNANEQFTFYAHCNRKAGEFYEVTNVNYYNESIAFSTGKDGEINVWNLELKDILCSIQLGEEVVSSAITEQHFVFVVSKEGKSSVKSIAIEPLLEEVNVTPAVETFGTFGTPVVYRGRRKAVPKKAKKEKKEKKETTKKRKPRRKFEESEDESIEDSDDDFEISRKKVKKEAVEYSLGGKGIFGCKIHLTGYSERELARVKQSLKKCGYFGVTTEITMADVVVTKNELRTVAILTALLHDIPVVNAKWVTESIRKKSKQDYDNYLLKNKFGALNSKKFNHDLLKGKTISSYGVLKIDENEFRMMLEKTGATFSARNKYADIVLIGAFDHKTDATLRTTGYAVNERWLYDCISEMEVKSVKDYLVEGQLKKERAMECESTTPKTLPKRSEQSMRNERFEEYKKKK